MKLNFWTIKRFFCMEIILLDVDDSFKECRNIFKHLTNLEIHFHRAKDSTPWG